MVKEARHSSAGKSTRRGLGKPSIRSRKGPINEAVNRRLIRPNLSEIKERFPTKQTRRKPVPPEQTNAESFYYIKQMQVQSQMVIVMKDGEQLQGWIEWYDKTCLKVNRQGEPNLLVMKSCVKYMYKLDENGGGREN